MIGIYSFLSYLFLFFSPFYLIFRILKNKENSSRMLERFGISKSHSSGKKTIWVHVASVGEFNSVVPLIKKIISNHPEFHVLLTSCTVTSANLAAKKFASFPVTHHFLPFDVPCIIRAFLKKWKVKIVFFTESELWPNTILEVSKKMPILLLNARMSKNSFKKWQKFPKIAKFLLQKFNLIIAGSVDDAGRFEKLGVGDLKLFDNLKFSVIQEFLKESELASEKINSLKKFFMGRKIIIYASTRGFEEEIALKIHENLAARGEKILTILAPREIKRCAELENLIYGKNLKFFRSSEDEIRDIDVILVDEMGKMSIFYAISQIAFMGGSLVDHGGQNPLEPASLFNYIITGPNCFNFKEIYDIMLEREAAFIIQNEQELFELILQLFENEGKISLSSENAKNFANSKQQVLENYYDEIEKWIKKSL